MARDSIDVLVKANASKFNSEMTKAKSSVKSFRQSVAAADAGGAGAFKGLIAGAMKLGAVIGTVALAVKGLKAIIGLVTDAFTDLDTIGKTSEKLGVASDRLIGLHWAASQTGVSANTMDMALQRMVRRISEAAHGSGEAKDALKELGINAKQLAQLSPDEQFRVIADAMEGVSNQGDKVRLAMNLFDSEGVALVNTMKGGSKALDDFQAEAEKLGLPAPTEEIVAANDAWNKFKMSLVGLGRAIAITIAPAIEWLGEVLAKAGIWIRETFTTIQPVIRGWALAMGAHFKAVWGIIKAVVNQILAIFEPLVDWFVSVSPSTTGDWVDTMVAYYAMVEYSWNNLGAIWGIVVKKIALGLVTIYEDFKNYFINVIPTILTEFGSGTLDFFANLASNVGNAIKQLWDYITSWGDDSIEITWKPLADGYKHAIEKTKEALEREETPTEALLRKEIEAQTKAFNKGMAAHVAKRLEESHQEAEKQGKKAGKAYNEAFNSKINFEDKKKTEKALAPKAVQFGTQEAFEIIYQAMKAQPDPAEVQLVETKKQTKLLGKIEDAIRAQQNLELARIA